MVVEVHLCQEVSCGLSVRMQIGVLCNGYSCWIAVRVGLGFGLRFGLRLGFRLGFRCRQLSVVAPVFLWAYGFASI